MDKDTLFQLYVSEQRAMDEVASLLGVSKHTVARGLKKHGISSRSRLEARYLAKKPTYTEDQLEEMRARAALMRQKITPESIEKHRQKMLGRTPPNKGKKMSEAQRQILIAQRADPEYRRRQSEARRGPNHYRWKGGVKDELARRLDTAEWRRTRKECYERDGWICQDCSCKCLNSRDSKLYPKRKIQAHHIVSRRSGGSDELSNLVTLCMSCHHKRERSESI